MCARKSGDKEGLNISPDNNIRGTSEVSVDNALEEGNDAADDGSTTQTRLSRVKHATTGLGD